MFDGIWSSVTKAVKSAVVERSDVGDLRNHWASVQRFFNATYTATDEQLAEMRHQLPDVADRLSTIADLVADEQLESGGARRPCFHVVFGEGDHEQGLLVHVCQLAKPNQPTGARPVVLRFLAQVLAAADDGSSTVFDDAPNVAEALLDTLSKAYRDLQVSRAFESNGNAAVEEDVAAVANLLALLCNFVQHRPALLDVLKPAGGTPLFLLDCVEELVGSLQVSQSPRVAVPAFNGLTSLCLTLTNPEFVAACVARVPQLLRVSVAGVLNRTLMTVSKVPQNEDIEDQVLLCAETVRLLDTLMVLAPPAATTISSDVRKEIFDDTVSLLLKSHDDRGFIACAATLTTCLRCTVDGELAILFAECVIGSPTVREGVLRRCGDMSDDVACVAMGLLRVVIEKAPRLAMALLLGMSSDAPLGAAVAVGAGEIDAMFPQELVSYTDVCCGVAGASLSEEGDKRTMLAEATANDVLVGTARFISSVATSHVVAVLCGRLRCAMQQCFAVNCAVTGLITTIAALPNRGIAATLLTPSGPLTAALQQLSSEVTLRFSQAVGADYRVLYEQFIATKRADDALSRLSEGADGGDNELVTAALVTVELFRRELRAVWDSHASRTSLESRVQPLDTQ
jgi:hypothetical protein